MEYENKYRPKWYQLGLLIFYSVAIVYTVLVNNPYLYSSKQYQEGLAGKKDNSFQPVVTQLGAEKSGLSKAQMPDRFHWEMTASDPSDETRDRRYVEVTLTPLFMELDKKPENAQWALLKNHVVMNMGETIYAADYEGKTLWQFNSQNTGEGQYFFEPAADTASIYLTNSSGHIYNLFLDSGKLLWSSRLDGELLSRGFVFENNLYVILKTKKPAKDKKKAGSQAQLVAISRIDGKLEKTSEDLGLKAEAQFSFDKDSNLLFITSAEKLVALKMPEMESVWQKSLSSDVVGPAVITEKRVLVSLKEGKVKVYNLNKGNEIHEIELEQPLASPPALIPIYNRAAVTSTDGYQHVMDLDGGKRLWRFDLNNKNNMWSSWSARLSGNFIEELQMKWRYKGWTIWSPCVQKRICIYNPEKGQIVGRVMLSGQLSSLPRYQERSFHVLLEQETGYALGHYMERPAAKKISQTPSTAPKQPEPSEPEDSTDAGG